jgi:protein-disulfide isomerase
MEVPALPWSRMTSGKKTKRRRQAVRAAPPPVRGGEGKRRASPRVLFAAAALLALIVAGIVLGIAFGSGDGSSTTSVPTRGSLENGLPGAADVEQLLKGIPQDGNVLGSASAPATLVEYIDLQCPFCQQFETQAMPTLIKRYVRPGKAKVEMRPIAFIGPDSENGRDAVIAAGQQKKAFNLTQLLYLNQGPENSGWLSDQLITTAAASIPGMNVPKLLDDRDSTETKNAAASFDELAQRDGVQQTPTILVGKSGQTPQQVTLSSPSDVQSIANALDSAIG